MRIGRPKNHIFKMKYIVWIYNANEIGCFDMRNKHQASAKDEIIIRNQQNISNNPENDANIISNPSVNNQNDEMAICGDEVIDSLYSNATSSSIDLEYPDETTLENNLEDFGFQWYNDPEFGKCNDDFINDDLLGKF